MITRASWSAPTSGRLPAIRTARIHSLVLALTLLLPLPACRHSHVSGTASTDVVLSAFKDGGFDVAGMNVVQPDTFAADHCVAGRISELDVLVCEFETDEALAAAETDVRRGWDTVNVDTGVVLHNGRTMLTIADRAKRDPSGRAIARLLNAFRALP